MSFTDGKRALLAVAGVVAALVLGACGSDGDEDTGGSASGGEGGEVTISQTSQPDFLDPALTYTVNGIEPLWLVYTPLLTYRRAEGAEGAELIPGLAEDLPKISEDGKTYELKLRDGLKYSDGTPVVASDFEHAVKRVLNLESGGASFYERIVGATDYESAGDPEADISGIETNDKTGEIKIEIEEPYAAFSNVLGLWFAAPVPGDTPFKNLTNDPPPGVGPYMVTESVPNRQFVMERNEEFDKLNLPDIPSAHVDKITTEIVKNASQQAQDVLDGELDYMQDPPPTDLLPTVREQASDRYSESVASSTYYFFMNLRTPPFDDPLVREAVNYGIDKPALARLFGGLLKPGCSFIPPGTPGYDEAFDTTECPYGDPTQPPDMAKAQELIKQAGAEGTKVTVWGNNDDPSDKVTEAYADMLNEMGFDATPKSWTAACTSRRSGTQRRRRRPASPTGSSTSPTRSTCISSSIPTRSSRRTIRTSATSTTRRSPMNSVSSSWRRTWRLPPTNGRLSTSTSSHRRSPTSPLMGIASCRRSSARRWTSKARCSTRSTSTTTRAGRSRTTTARSTAGA